MTRQHASIRRIDRMAIGLSALCGLHCLATTLLIGALASVGGILASPMVHEVGLMIAILLGALALGLGVRHHGALKPLFVGFLGLGVMALALLVPHGQAETAVTLTGVAILAFGHFLNQRSTSRVVAEI